jgi:hypothetical protein
MYPVVGQQRLIGRELIISRMLEGGWGIRGDFEDPLTQTPGEQILALTE